MGRMLKAHLPLIKKIARRLAVRLPSNIEVDDLVQVGMIAFHESAGRYDKTKNASFETYISARIRGAMFDELRKQDWASRYQRSEIKETLKVTDKLKKALGRQPLESEVASALGIKTNDYRRRLTNISFESLTEHGIEEISTEPGPFETLYQKQAVRFLTREIKKLTGDERQVAELYYDQGLSQVEISEILKVSPSRISQLVSFITLGLAQKFKSVEQPVYAYKKPPRQTDWIGELDRMILK